MADELIFKTRKDFRKWLSANSSHQGVWLVFGKKGVLVPRVSIQTTSRGTDWGLRHFVINETRGTGTCLASLTWAFVGPCHSGPMQLVVQDGVRVIVNRHHSGTDRVDAAGWATETVAYFWPEALHARLAG